MLLSSVAVAAPAEPAAGSVMASYQALVDRNCPEQHLDWLSPGELNYATENFHEALSPSEKSKVDQLLHADSSCADRIAGIGCSNVVYLRALIKLNLLPKFVADVCKITCLGPVECLQAPPDQQ
jgi:hypothetical protein